MTIYQVRVRVQVIKVYDVWVGVNTDFDLWEDENIKDAATRLVYDDMTTTEIMDGGSLQDTSTDHAEVMEVRDEHYQTNPEIHQWAMKHVFGEEEE